MGKTSLLNSQDVSSVVRGLLQQPNNIGVVQSSTIEKNGQKIKQKTLSN